MRRAARRRTLTFGGGLTAMALPMLLTSLSRSSMPYPFLVLMMMLFGLDLLVASSVWATVCLVWLRWVKRSAAGSESGKRRVERSALE